MSITACRFVGMPASGLSWSDGGGRAGPCGAGKRRTQGAILTSTVSGPNNY
jgi:hypothetical protein